MSADKWCARTDLALETQESLKKANTDMRGVNFSEKKLDNGIIVKEIKANFYKCGDELQTPHFLSWNPIQIEQPDFHRPDFFGTLEFE